MPIILFDINGNKISKQHISKNHCIYFYSYQNISVRILQNNVEFPAVLYSVKQIGTALETQQGQEFTDNFGYTLYIPSGVDPRGVDSGETSPSKTTIEVSNGESISVYSFTLGDNNNTITEINQHYNDLLVNYNLPSFDKLLPALVEGSDSSELLKRLLLEFRSILKFKGTKESVNKFFQFIGYNSDNLSILDEYQNPNNLEPTTTPNKQVDIKTGNYHVLYNNYFETAGYDKNNLPIRELHIQNLDKFFEHLVYAISLANTYFTLKEQDITFFGINYSSNIANEPGITSTFNYIFEHDVYNFRKQLHIDLWTHIDSTSKLPHIDNCLFVDDNLYRTEVKTYTENQDIFYNRLLYMVDREIFDDEPIDDSIPLDKISRVFGTVAHLRITSPETYIQFEFSDTVNPTNRLVFNRQWVDDDIYIKFVISNVSNYILHVTITDKYNNTEVFEYNFNLSDDVKRIDFETFNSVALDIDNLNERSNNINLDVSSPSVVTSRPSDTSNNYILPFYDIPEDLSEYYNAPVTGFIKWLSENDKYILPEANLNYQVDTFTESIPVEFSESWLSILAFKYDPSKTLYLKIFNINTCEYQNIPIHSIPEYYPIFDTLYMVLMDVIEVDDINGDNGGDGAGIETTNQYYFITTTETGIDFSKHTYNFVLVDSEDNEISIYDDLIEDQDIYKLKIPVNYDFPLFEIKSKIVTEFQPFISESENTEQVGTNDFVIIRSIFPRLLSIDVSTIDNSINNGINSGINSFYLKLGDIVFCRLNSNYIVNEKDIVWKVFNSFTKDVLFETSDSTLKYRIDSNTIYDILVEFTINNERHSIYKESIFSSFVKQYY